jgi:hypothetical protein
MALRKCRDCGNRVSTKAKTCPNCGAPAAAHVGRAGVAVVALIATGLFVATKEFTGKRRLLIFSPFHTCSCDTAFSPDRSTCGPRAVSSRTCDTPTEGYRRNHIR